MVGKKRKKEQVERIDFGEEEDYAEEFDDEDEEPDRSELPEMPSRPKKARPKETQSNVPTASRLSQQELLDVAETNLKRAYLFLAEFRRQAGL